MFKKVLGTGKGLAVTHQYVKDEINEKSEKLATERDAALKLWDDHKTACEQYIDLMKFYRGKCFYDECAVS